MRVNFLIFIILLYCFGVSAQDKKNTAADSSKAYKKYLNVRDVFYSNPVKAKQYAKESIHFAEIEKNPKQKAKSLNALGLLHRFLSEYDSAVVVFDKCIKIADSVGDFSTFGNAVNNQGMVYYFYGDYQKANEVIVNILERCRKEKDNQLLAVSYSNLGLINKEQKRYKEALERMKMSSAYYDSIGDIQGKSATLMNQGIIYYEHLGEHDKAIEMYEKAVEIKELINDVRGLVQAYCNLASTHLDLKQYQKSEHYAQKGLEIAEQINDNFGKAFLYNHFADLYTETGKLDIAETYGKKALEQAKSNQTKKEIIRILEQLSKIQYAKSDYKTAYDNFQEAAVLRDSILNQENFEKMVELETRYETKEKETRILEQRAVIAESKLKIENKNSQIILAGFLLLASILLGYIFFYRQKQKAKRLEKENQLKDAYAKIETQNQLHQQRLKISRELHDNIGSQLTFITSSLENIKYYFKEKNTEVNEKIDNISRFTKQTIIELRDTIWAMNKGEIAFEDLQERLADFMNNAALSVDTITFDFSIDNNLKNSKHNFTSLEGINLYRVIQEAVNNAVKHSKANTIKVDICPSDSSNEQFLISITDDGKGFSVNENNSGNGLANMRKRIEEIGGKISFSSTEDTGSTITIEL